MFTHHYPARCFGMNIPESRDILEWEIVINNKYRDKMGKIVYNMKYEIK